MSLPHLELQEAAYDLLRIDLILQEVLGSGNRVFDYVPETQTGNYVVIGDQTLQVTQPGLDKSTYVALLAIHAYSDNHRGKKIVADISSVVHSIMHNAKVEPGCGTFIFRFLSSVIETLGVREHHGQVNFRIVMVL